MDDDIKMQRADPRTLTPEMLEAMGWSLTTGNYRLEVKQISRAEFEELYGVKSPAS